MIQITVQHAARKRKITKAYQLQTELGFSPAVAADLWKGEKLPRLETLGRLCDAWHCSIAELVRWVPEVRRTSSATAKRNGSTNARKRSK